MATKVNLGDAENALQQLAELASSISGIGPSELRKALQFGAQEAEPLAQDYAIRNFNKSGVKSRTGNLKSAISNARLELSRGSLLRFSLEPGKSEKFYVRANAVNYGAIRSPEGNKGTLKEVRGISGGTTTQLYRNLGKRKRANIKKKLQGTIDKSKRTQKVGQGLTLDTASVKVTKAGSVSGQTSLGKVTVTKAFDYFSLSNRQKAVIVNEVVKEAWFFIENLIGRKVK